MYELLSRGELEARLPAVRVVVPPSAVVGTDVFDRFLAEGDLLGFALRETDDGRILERFLEAELPGDVLGDLATFVERVGYPVAVRSSSLLEDAHDLPAAGIYPTHMLPNVEPDPGLRLEQLARAIKNIYASTFYHEAKAYLDATPNRVEDEKMAVVIQQVVGRRHGRFVYPDMSGVARSLNFYRVGDLRVEDGIASVALGLGKTVVEGGRTVRFSPARPGLLPQLSGPADVVKNAQRDFWALDVTLDPGLSAIGSGANLVRLDLAAAEEHGSLGAVGSVYSPDNDALYDGLARSGVRLVTFAPILKHDLFPLAEALRVLLSIGQAGMSGPVEIEFAANVRPVDEAHELAFLQIRPMVIHEPSGPLDLGAVSDADCLVRSGQAMGSGRLDDIRDVVAVRPDGFDRSRTPEIAAEIEQRNASLLAAGRPYLLLGPGRWGTADRWLGIPVRWFQIAGARAIVETELEDLAVEPSQGTHFFHNLMSLGVGYFTVDARRGDRVDWPWLLAQPTADSGRWTSHYELAVPLSVRIDGRSGRGVVLKRDRA
jgi:hypothetical protein